MIAQTDRLATLLGLDRFLIRRPSLHICERTWSWSPPPLTDFDIWFVLEGGGTLRVNGQDFELVEGDGFLLQPGDTVAGRKDPDSQLTVFACHMQPVPPLDRRSRLCAEALRFRITDLTLHRRLIDETLHLTQTTGGAVLAKALVAEIILRAVLSRSPARTQDIPGTLQDLVVKVKSNPRMNWTLRGMAKSCFLSVPQFTRTFRRAFGASPLQFVITQRILRAIHLLRESRSTIQQIAADLGYSDHYFFHRQFKSITGVTPLMARRGARISLVEDTDPSQGI